MISIPLMHALRAAAIDMNVHVEIYMPSTEIADRHFPHAISSPTHYYYCEGNGLETNHTMSCN